PPPPVAPGAPVSPAAPAPRGRAAAAQARARQQTLFALLERRLSLTPSGVWTVVAAVVLWSAARLLTSRGLALAAYGLVVVVVSAWLLGRRTLSVETDRSELPRRVRARRPVSVEIKLRAARRITGVIVEETLDRHLGQPVRVPVPLLPAGKEIVHQYRFSPSRRGAFNVGPLVAEWSDPFGLTRHRQEIAPSVEILVHPDTEPVADRITSREWEDPPVRPPVSKPWPNGFEFYGMRDYVEGDDPRRIVWRAFAQYDRYLVRESEQGITDRIHVYLDTDRAVYESGEDSPTFELSVKVAASLATSYLKSGFTVTLHTGNELRPPRFRGGGSQIAVLDRLARVERIDKPLAKAVERMLTDPQGSAHNVIVTPSLSAEAAARLRLLRQRGTSMLVVVILGEEPDALSLRRAGSLGCNVAEVAANTPLSTLFQHIVSSRR
ncbi:MAG: hypothetical protein QOI20_3143, partial [Acidimicrobiaceae bacterium]|nr:hypothetical protein [Acidimicrobiaceae bacterium]